MNAQNVIITPDIAHLIARRILAASLDYTLNRDLPDRFLRELKTALRGEIAAAPSRSVNNRIRELTSRLTTMSYTGVRPVIGATPTRELTDDIVAYCAEAPRTLGQLRCRIRLFGRVEDQRATTMVRDWERRGLIRNSGTAIRHRWVPGSRSVPLLAPQKRPQAGATSHRQEGMA